MRINFEEILRKLTLFSLIVLATIFVLTTLGLLLRSLEEIAGIFQLYNGNSRLLKFISDLSAKKLISDSGFALADLCGVNVILVITGGIFLRWFNNINNRRRQRMLSVMQFPQIEKIKDDKVKQSLIAALRNLTIETVDMGLFYLGKVFENQVRLFLTEARAANKIPVTNADLASLKTMIDCLGANGIQLIEDKSEKQIGYLHFLREQRNQRAHGQIPSLEERQKLMRQSWYLADLYLDCIVSIEKYRDELHKDLQQSTQAPPKTRFHLMPLRCTSRRK